VIKQSFISLICVLASAVGMTTFAADYNRYELNVGDFSVLSVQDNVNVIYKCSEDSAGIAVYNATPELADRLLFDFSKKGKLIVQTQFHEDNTTDFEVPEVTVYSKFLTRVQNSGDSTVRVVSVAACPKFEATVVGNGNIVIKEIHATEFSAHLKTGHGQISVAGVCDKAVYNNVGVGSILADRMQATDASCRFFGTGTIGVWVLGVLTVKGMSGKLYYKVTPEKIRNYSMGVKLYPMDGSDDTSSETTDSSASE
jgi:hypothetical protein